MRKGSIKSIMINSEVQKELSNIIRNELKDPRIHPMTTVLSADVTTDLKFCKVAISVMADEESQKETMEGLKSATPFIRRELAATVNLRNTPQLKFVLDKGIEQGIYMSHLIDEVAEKDRLAREARGEEEDSEENDSEEYDFEADLSIKGDSDEEYSDEEDL